MGKRKASVRMFAGRWLDEIKADFDAQVEEAIEEAITGLAAIGEHAVTIARDQGSYNDITGNLRSSIGYVILRDGEPVLQGESRQFSGPKGDGKEGVQVAEALLDQLRSEYPSGLVLIVCAGMNYASFVEDVHGLDVLTSAQLDTEQQAAEMVKELFTRH